MMKKRSREITEEQYLKVLAKNERGRLTEDIKYEMFEQWEFMYGVYNAYVVEMSGKYYLCYDMGTSCD